MSIIRIGTVVETHHGISEVTFIEEVPPGEKEGGIAVEEVDTERDNFVIDMANGHWSYASGIRRVISHPARSI